MSGNIRNAPQLLLIAALAFACFPALDAVAETAPASQSSNNQTKSVLPDWTGPWRPVRYGMANDNVATYPGEEQLVLLTDSEGAAALEENRGLETFEMRQPIPYKPEWQQLYDENLRALRTTGIISDNSAECLPLGMPRMMFIPFPLEFVVQPGRVIVIFEQGRSVRWIYTDGREHTPIEELDPSFVGESIGHWEGDTLVVDTIGIREDAKFDFAGAIHSDALHIVERIRRISENMLEIEMTFEDPKAFTAPWTVKRYLQRRPDMILQEFVCENNRSFAD